MNVDIEKEMYSSSEDQLIAVKSYIPSPDLDCISLNGKTSPQPDTQGDKNEESSVSKELTKVAMALETSQTHGTSEVKDSKDLSDLHLPGSTSIELITVQPKDKNEDSANSEIQLCKSGNTAPEECQITLYSSE